jgi:hypothetical protein
MANPQLLAIDLIRLDGDTQNRVEINEDTVEDYAELIRIHHPDWPFPPLDVFTDGSDYWVGDGFHRLLAGRQAKRGSVLCVVRNGTARDARIFGMTANDRNGLRMTHADKRACVEWLLDQPEKMTQAAVAETAGVTPRTVRRIVADLKAGWHPPKTTGQVSGPSGGSGNEPPGSPETAPELDTPPAEGREEPEKPGTGKCPNCGGTKWDECEDKRGVFFSCNKCRHDWGEPVGDVDEEPELTAREQIQIWYKAVGLWMPQIDEYREMWPGPAGNEVIEAAKALYEVLGAWKKWIK